MSVEAITRRSGRSSRSGKRNHYIMDNGNDLEPKKKTKESVDDPLLEEAASSLLALADIFLSASSIRESQFNMPKHLSSHFPYTNMNQFEEYNKPQVATPLVKSGDVEQQFIAYNLHKWDKAPHVKIAHSIYYSKAINRYAEMPNSLVSYQMYPYLDPSQESRTLKELSNIQTLPTLMPKELSQYNFKRIGHQNMPQTYSPHTLSTYSNLSLWSGDPPSNMRFDFVNRTPVPLNEDSNKENKKINAP